MFVGSHQHTIDGNGRLILPSHFRARLADGAFVTPIDNCLAVLPPGEFEQMARNLEAETGEGLVGVNALRAFASRADYVVPDAQGRMRILPHLREAAGLDRNVVVTGAIYRVEVWDPDRWAAIQADAAEGLVEAIARGRGIGRS